MAVKMRLIIHQQSQVFALKWHALHAIQTGRCVFFAGSKHDLAQRFTATNTNGSLYVHSDVSPVLLEGSIGSKFESSAILQSYFSKKKKR